MEKVKEAYCVVKGGGNTNTDAHMIFCLKNGAHWMRSRGQHPQAFAYSTRGSYCCKKHIYT